MKRSRRRRRIRRINIHTTVLCIIIPLMIIFSVVVTPYGNSVGSFCGKIDRGKLLALRLIWLAIVSANLYGLYKTKANKHWLFLIYAFLGILSIAVLFWLFLL